MMLRLNPIVAIPAMVLGAMLGTAPARATTVSPMNIADLVSRSSEIVVGSVSAVNQGRQGGLPYVEVQLKVSDAIRGSANGALTFRSIGLTGPQAPANGRVLVGSVPGMPRYAVGEKVVLFLGPVSRLGLRAPIGLQQGKFVSRLGGLQNDIQNVGLFRNVSMANKRLSESELSMVATTQGAVDFGTFVSLVRRAVTENWWPVGGSPGGGGRRPPPIRRPAREVVPVSTPSQPAPVALGAKEGGR